MFESLWKNFDSRFKSILESLRKAQQLVDQEAHTRDIVEARAFRTTQMEALRQWETERLKKVEDAERKQRRESLREAVSWVGSSHEQDEEFQEHLYRLTDRTCSTWITSIALLKEWFEEGGCRHPSIWLNGKPGAGSYELQEAFIVPPISADRRHVLRQKRHMLSNRRLHSI